MTTPSNCLLPGYVAAGSQTGFYPKPPNPPGWGLLFMGLLILMLLFLIWLFRGLCNDIDQPDDSGGVSQLWAPDSKAQYSTSVL